MKKILIAAILSLGIIACGKEEVKIEYGKEYKVKDGNQTIVFEKDKIHGFAGVNNYFGNYKLEKDYFKAKEMGVTMMAGDKKSMESEAKFLDELAGASKIETKGNELILKSKDDVKLKFYLMNNL